MCCESFWSCLSFKEPPRHAQCTEGRAEQHYRGAAVRNSAAWAKERPPDKIASNLRGRNRDIPTQIGDVPNLPKNKPIMSICRKQV